ncbi:transmembrane 4 L6 family member 5 [Protopterus annectens]|uniref:transmembrane 4 L6 family member 5 n=1 Tax=Protopterus annectens TaxID=7888 RepID=UPI001CFC1C22|nr:transmembrane 4 L6 family member 5 [Protopterus annectens]
MCTGKCSRFIGLVLIPMALTCIIANVLLIFPNADGQWTKHITTEVWLMGGIAGGGVFMLCPGLSAVRAGGKGCCGTGCCGNRCRMLRSVLCSVVGILGAFYCFMVSLFGLIDGPLCETANDKWEKPFVDLRKNESYLFHKEDWSKCLRPPNIVLWNIVLFSIMLGMSILEAVFCAFQIINGCIGVFCGDCRKEGKSKSKDNDEGL